MKEKKIFKFWWSWDAEKIARWLEKKAGEGWILQRTTFSMMNFYFVCKEPVKMSFCADFRISETQEYIHFMQEAGWNLISQMSSWFLWARTYREGERKPAFFSDTDSLIARNKRLLLFIIPASMLQLPALSINMKRYFAFDNPFLSGLGLFHLLLTGILFYAVVKTIQNSRKLKKTGSRY